MKKIVISTLLLALAFTSCDKQDRCYNLQNYAGDYVKTHCFQSQRQLNRWKSECNIREDGLKSYEDDCWGL